MSITKIAPLSLAVRTTEEQLTFQSRNRNHKPIQVNNLQKTESKKAIMAFQNEPTIKPLRQPKATRLPQRLSELDYRSADHRSVTAISRQAPKRLGQGKNQLMKVTTQ